MRLINRPGLVRMLISPLVLSAADSPRVFEELCNRRNLREAAQHGLWVGKVPGPRVVPEVRIGDFVVWVQ